MVKSLTLFWRTTLSHLELVANNIWEEGAEILAGVLVQCTTLTHLNLEDNKIGAAHARMLARVLTQCPGARLTAPAVSISLLESCALSKHSCKALCPGWSDAIAAEIEVTHRCALPT